MDLQTIKNMVSSEEYNFLRNNDHLGNRIILIGLGGSHAYGTNNETSDLDVRGCALNSKEEILTNQHYEQFVDEKTDTTVYAFNKLISLLCNCNPNTIEMLGLKRHRLSVDMLRLSLEDLIIKQQGLSVKRSRSNTY